MIWNNVELINVERVERRYDGAYKLFRFPENVHRSLGTREFRYPLAPAEGCAGCEIRFIADDADVVMSSGGVTGSVEVYRGDFLYATVTIPEGVCKRIPLRCDNPVQLGDMRGVTTYFASNMWRIVCSKDLPAVIHDIVPLSDIRPPKKEEGYQKTILAYGTSITQSSGASNPSSGYLAVVGKKLHANVLNKGLGGSCLCEKEIAHWLPTVDCDMLILEPMGNMLSGGYEADVFKERLDYTMECFVKTGKPVVLISCHRFLCSREHTDGIHYEAFLDAMKEIYEKYKDKNTYFIDGNEIMDDYTYLHADLTHPTDYGHFMMGMKIADKIENEFKLI